MSTFVLWKFSVLKIKCRSRAVSMGGAKVCSQEAAIGLPYMRNAVCELGLHEMCLCSFMMAMCG